MPDPTPDTLIPPGASGEEILRHVLPVLIQTLTKSAEGQTLGAAAIQQLEGRLQEMHNAVAANTSEVKRLADAKLADAQRQEENSKLIRSLLKPEVLYYTLVLIFAILGVRLTIPAPLQSPLQATVQQFQSGE